jgi:hypothetical protein
MPQNHAPDNFVGLDFMYLQLLLCLDWHLCAMHARHSFCKVEG